MTKNKYNLEDIIAKNKWYYLNPNITEKNFPLPEKIETEGWKIIRMDKSFTSQEALERIKKEGCKPANIYELALFRNNHPEEFPKGKYTWVLALGSDFTGSDGNHRVPVVSARGDGAFVFRLGGFGHPWGGDGCLLCFCDSSSDSQDLSHPSDTLTLRVEKLEAFVDHLKKFYVGVQSKLSLSK